MLLAAALCLAALAPARALAQPHPKTSTTTSTTTSTKTRKPASQPAPLSSDQLSVVAASINDTFPRPRHEPLTLALCLDVQIATAVDEDAPAPPPRRRGARKRAPEPEVPPQPIVRGAPPELLAGLARPWRVVASALSCRLDPRQPIALADERHTPAQLVTVHLAPDVAAGPLTIDWRNGHDPTAANSRDCTAARGPRGWTVRCGGTWFQ
jgi:hypothetical protein